MRAHVRPGRDCAPGSCFCLPSWIYQSADFRSRSGPAAGRGSAPGAPRPAQQRVLRPTPRPAPGSGAGRASGTSPSPCSPTTHSRCPAAAIRFRAAISIAPGRRADIRSPRPDPAPATPAVRAHLAERVRASAPPPGSPAAPRAATTAIRWPSRASSARSAGDRSRREGARSAVVPRVTVAPARRRIVHQVHAEALGQLPQRRYRPHRGSGPVEERAVRREAEPGRARGDQAARTPRSWPAARPGAASRPRRRTSRTSPSPRAPAPATGSGTTVSPGDRVDARRSPASPPSRPGPRAVDPHRALPEVRLHRRHRVDGQRTGRVLIRYARARLRSPVRASEAYTCSSTSRRRPANSAQARPGPARTRGSGVSGIRAVVTMAPALIMALAGRPVPRSRLIALNASPLGSVPDPAAHLVEPELGQGQGVHERFRHGLDRERHLGVAGAGSGGRPC